MPDSLCHYSLERWVTCRMRPPWEVTGQLPREHSRLRLNLVWKEILGSIFLEGLHSPGDLGDPIARKR